jgi:hypothetical protein
MKKRDKQKQAKLEKKTAKRALYEKARKNKKFVPKLPPPADA